MSLLNTIRKSENIRKIFGKRELVIIEKQIKGVRLKPSEKTRLSRDIRKKFEAVKEIAQYVNEFDLKHGKEIKDTIKEVREVILESKYLPDIEKIILFGSVAENQITLSSDIDIAVVFKKEPENATRFRLDILKKISDKVDIQVYNSLPKKVREEIDKKGKLVWKRE